MLNPFNKDPKKRLAKHVENLRKIGMLPSNWRWTKEKILALENIGDELIRDLNTFHERRLDSPEQYSRLMPLLVNLHKDLDYMQKHKNLTTGTEEREAAKVNSLLETLKNQTWNETVDKILFSGITLEVVYIGGIAGTIYTNRERRNGNSILIITGIFVSRRNFELLARRLAFQGYTVMVIDLPSQGESKGEWRLGLMSEFITKCVYHLREVYQKRTIIGNRSKVAVIGHSAGAVASMFSALSYNQQVENTVYSIFERYGVYNDQLISINKKIEAENGTSEDNTKKIILEIIIGQIYTELKDVILKSLKNERFKCGGIDAIILLAPPPRFQEVMPSEVAKLLGNANQKNVKKALDTFVNTPLEWFRKKEMPGNPSYSDSETAERYLISQITGGNTAVISGLNRLPNISGSKITITDETVRLHFLRVKELKSFMTYIAEIKNPVDYMNLLLFFQDKSDFIRHYLTKVVNPVPKLYIYGRWDALLRGFSPRLLLSGIFIGKNRKTEIEKVYDLLGNSKKIMLPNTSHFLNENDYLSVNLNNQMITDKGAVREILEFLDKSLQ